MTDAGKVMLNKAKDIKAYCESIECVECPFHRQVLKEYGGESYCELDWCPTEWDLDGMED